MDFFSYWTEQIAPYAEKASPILTSVLLVAFISYWVVWFRQKKSNRDYTAIDWTKIPLTITMLVYTFQWAFVPDFGSFLGDFIVMLFIFISLMWLINHYKTPLVDEESEQGSSDEKAE